ncbi:MAG: hypothetical protein U0237_01670 [Thermoleophilia bacterium]
MTGGVPPVRPEPLRELIARVADAEHALVALGIPRCPACMLLPASLTAVAGARPGLPVGIALFERPEDWELREELLWPRGIRVSRSSVPVLALMRSGEAVATRMGGAPAHMIDRWLDPHLGPAAHPVPEAPTEAEAGALEAMSRRRAQQTIVKGRDPLG